MIAKNITSFYHLIDLNILKMTTIKVETFVLGIKSLVEISRYLYTYVSMVLLETFMPAKPEIFRKRYILALIQ